MNNPTMARYISAGKLLAAMPSTLTEWDRLALGHLRLGDEIWRKSETIVNQVSGKKFVPIADIAKAIDCRPVYAANLISYLKTGGVQIRGTFEKGYRLPTKDAA